MNVAVVIPSIRKFKHWEGFQKELDNVNFDYTIFVVGEDENESGINDCFFIGRKDIPDGFPQSLRGLDWCYYKIYKENKFDAVISFDDDVKHESVFFFQEHIERLLSPLLTSECYTNPLIHAYPRGLPHDDRKLGKVILHQGLWTGDGDFFVKDKLTKPLFDTIDYGIARHGAITISSMNISFRPEIIPAFYQPPIRRYDDIWSGLILKRIADQMGHYITFGNPVVEHIQAPRDLWKDYIQEEKYVKLNNDFWTMLHQIAVTKKTYGECYREIAEQLKVPFQDQMLKWCDWIEKI